MPRGHCARGAWEGQGGGGEDKRAGFGMGRGEWGGPQKSLKEGAQAECGFTVAGPGEP